MINRGNFHLDVTAQARAHAKANDCAAWSKAWIERHAADEAAGRR